MKRNSIRNILLAILALGFIGSAVQARADLPPGAYKHDRTGYWGPDHHHHDFIARNGHHGYWWNHIWISVD